MDRGVDLLSPESIESIQVLKSQHLGSRNPCLHIDEMLLLCRPISGCSSGEFL
ncbi:DUF1846 family protein [Corynebacterium glutamicum]|nr:DUF1846 domain-containing protein [Corynebacterium glutamicum]QDQ21889.1 DUF1846 family protein [Corynebacterium glutamicum]QDQ24715.1 DUF1846 family protein [Corynebacterium glutamicum]